MISNRFLLASSTIRSVTIINNNNIIQSTQYRILSSQTTNAIEKLRNAFEIYRQTQ